ncbi:RluA family pseudouridine synthase [Roseimarinus sediminis]|uniref:RluA family pseudouridine synthase n=1 Tax=Roseimarinus sediminis TaxID=1610899 RepID=UPI003D1D3DA3
MKHDKPASFKPANTTILNVDRDEELMKYLLISLKGKSRNNIKSLLSHQQILVNKQQISQFNHHLKAGDQITISNQRTQELPRASKQFSIIFEDEHLIIVDKQAGILSMGTQGEREHTVYFQLSQHVKQQNRANKIFIVHRLDRETSGVMVFAKSQKVKQLLQENWNQVLAERSYIAVVEGVFEKEHGSIRSYLHENKSMKVYSGQKAKDGKLAITHFKVIKRSSTHTLIELHLETGRKNQIRVHMQDAGHSIINDKKYGAQTNPIGRLGLHARVLSIKHPLTGKLLRFQTPIPPSFLKLF